VSIHADALPGHPHVEGVTVYYGDDWPEAGINVRGRAHFLAGHIGIKTFLTGLKQKVFKRAEEVFLFAIMLKEANRQGKRLAKKIAAVLSKGLGTPNRGIETKNLRVIRRCACPAVLVEVGFLTSPREERKLATRSHRQKVAYYLAQAILSFLKENVRKR
jgi:N-acetylmuramoyl-L-alanine amidase